jgi:putative acyl-CoA dehydrogenase
MTPHKPGSELRTHSVENQPPALGARDLYASDMALREALHREGAVWAEARVAQMGRLAGSDAVREWGEQANRFAPQLRSFDAYGRRLDEVEFHPAYHELMALAMANEVHSIAWTAGPGGHVAHVALAYLLTQAEAGVLCPMAMTYAAVPALRHQPDIAEQWVPRCLSGRYDGRMIPAAEKSANTIGMAMTEKQGGSDVRANDTRAFPLRRAGAGEAYLLTGHKWFCSAPMSDAFLTLAYTGERSQGLSCFLVPRWTPEGDRNRIVIQRLKDKLGNRSNASSEIEYDGTWALMLGEEGQGLHVILDMVHHTRLDTAYAPAGLMRAALVQALHHARHRSVFGRALVAQPLMRAVLADLALDAEAALTGVMRVARAFDESAGNPRARAFARLAVALMKFWNNKRCPPFIAEAMECLGGIGYVEEVPMARLYREAPLNGIWEGSGNVICLDILRTVQRQPESLEALFAEFDAARGGSRALDTATQTLKGELSEPTQPEARARSLSERMASCLAGALLVRHAPAAVADAFCASRLAGDTQRIYGGLPVATDVDAILARAMPA